MRNLIEYPITPQEVIEFLEDNAEVERQVVEAMGIVGSLDPLYSKITLAVVKAALIIVKNDLGSTAAELLEAAFNSQNVPAQPLEEEMAD